jgi:hypothetical protein
MVPSIQYSPRAWLVLMSLRYGVRTFVRYDILQHSRSDSAGERIEDISEMVFGEHRVSRICTRRVVPGPVLLVLTGVDDSGGSHLE